jgi:hypothetical protein
MVLAVVVPLVAGACVELEEGEVVLELSLLIFLLRKAISSQLNAKIM